MEARSFPALPTPPIPIKKPCANKFTLDCLLMEVARARKCSVKQHLLNKPKEFDGNKVNWLHNLMTHRNFLRKRLDMRSIFW
jgi:hypothetical protein